VPCVRRSGLRPAGAVPLECRDPTASSRRVGDPPDGRAPGTQDMRAKPQATAPARTRSRRSRTMERSRPPNLSGSGVATARAATKTTTKGTGSERCTNGSRRVMSSATTPATATTEHSASEDAKLRERSHGSQAASGHVTRQDLLMRRADVRRRHLGAAA
jgi:hypothetical protein